MLHSQNLRKLIQKLAEFKDSKQTGIKIYTDGSKHKNKAVAAVIDKDVNMGTMKQIRLQNPQSFRNCKVKTLNILLNSI